MTAPALAAVLERVCAVLPAAPVKVAVEAAGHYHRPLLGSGVWPAGWEVLELSPARVAEQRRVQGRRRVKTDAIDLEAITELVLAAMLTAMINGESDPLRLADLAKGRMRRKIPDLAQALTGHFDANHARLARSMLRQLDLVEQALAELDAVIVDACQPWAHQIELLQTIPGVGEKVAQVIIAETGGDMSRFPTAAHLAAWAGLAPAMNESAGKQSPAGKRHGNKWLTAMLVEAAGSVGRMHGKNYLAAQHARLLKRRGMGRAQVAVAHSMLVSAYWMLKRDQPYHDLGADWHRRRSDEAHTRRLVAQLEHLGHHVIIDPAA